ncbi:MAG: hypothetical protein VX115_02105 [Candidatus Thermoplasmatota archaeon]|nr:hypothetical protein [Candidatus Thermoplasmatota archaeon]
MNDLRKAPLFASLNDVINDAVTFLQSDPLLLVTTADLTSVLALGFLESALLDRGISYSRRILPPNSHIPPDEVDLVPKQSGVNVLFIDPWNRVETSMENAFIIAPKPVEVEFRNSQTSRRGRVDAVLQCAVVASVLATNGSRTKRCRPYAGCGQWLMESLDTTIDPIHTMVRDFLRDEGTIQVLPLPEIPDASVAMMPRASPRRLKRLQKLWMEMDAPTRAQALSEFSLPLLSSEGLSTARLEELIWKRMRIPNESTDLATSLYRLTKAWPEQADAAVLHAGRLADEILKTGRLTPSTD